MRPGQFRSASDGLTIYARDMERGGLLQDVVIHDSSDPSSELTYMARSGAFTEVRGEPALVLYDASIQSLDEQGALNYLTFDSYTFPLDTFLEAEGDLSYKLSDRYLDELLFPAPDDDWGLRLRDRLYAEAHYRLSAPLYAPALVLIALASILGGEFSRTGYARRIAIAAVTALLVRLVGFAVQSMCVDNIYLNPLQYAVPLVTIYFATQALFSSERHRLRRRRRRPPPEPALGAAPTPSPA